MSGSGAERWPCVEPGRPAPPPPPPPARSQRPAAGAPPLCAVSDGVRLRDHGEARADPGPRPAHRPQIQRWAGAACGSGGLGVAAAPGGPPPPPPAPGPAPPARARAPLPPPAAILRPAGASLRRRPSPWPAGRGGVRAWAAGRGLGAGWAVVGLARARAGLCVSGPEAAGRPPRRATPARGVTCAGTRGPRERLGQFCWGCCGRGELAEPVTRPSFPGPHEHRGLGL